MSPSVLLPLWISASLFGQGALEGKVFEKLHGKLTDTFAGPSSKGRSRVVLLISPAIPAPSTSKPTLDDLFYLSQITNPVPGPGWMYAPTPDSVPSVYTTLLTFGQVATPKPNAAAEVELRKARDYLYTRKDGPRRPSDAQMTYLKLQDEYIAALEKIENAKADARNGGTIASLSALEQSAAKALDRWEKEGARQKVEAAFAVIQKRYDQDLAVSLGKTKQKLTDLQNVAEQRDGKSWYRTETVPSLEQWSATDGWITWSFLEKELNAQPTRATGPTGTGSSQTRSLALGGSSFSIQGKVKRVDVLRPWMDQEIFYSRSWRFTRSSPIALVSSGQPDAKDAGVMPRLVTGLVLAKDLEITGTWSKDEISRALTSKTSQAIGPFAISSTQAQGPLKTSFMDRGNGQLTLRIEGIQILAYLCEVLPKVPDPDPTLVFSD
jgi:hypothetical protein